MGNLLNIGIFPLLLTIWAYQFGLFCQKKLRSPLCNPILIAVISILTFMALTGLDLNTYRQGTSLISWLMTPATVCLAIPMYEQVSLLRRNLPGILIGLASGALSCLLLVLLFAALVKFDRMLTISLLPKSITSAIGVPLAELYGGAGSITTPAIIITGIVASVFALPLCRLFRLTDPISRGVALGTSGHVIATARASELDPLTGAVSSLSLVIAGLLTSLVFPLVTGLL